MIWSKFTKKSDFLHFNEIWLMFRPIPMYETNAIQLHFLVRLFWYLSQWSGLICSIFCTPLYSKDIHCAMTAYVWSDLMCIRRYSAHGEGPVYMQEHYYVMLCADEFYFSWSMNVHNIKAIRKLLCIICWNM